MLALLASALLPGLAQAECTSAACITYIEEGSVPKSGVEGKTVKPHSNDHQSEKTEPKAKSSGTPSAGTGEPTESDGGSEEEKTGGGAGTSGGNGGTGNGPQGSQGGGGNKAGVSSNQQVATGSGQGPNTSPLESSSSSDSGGSSALVWIIIAVVVLAAISIGAYVIRQRRQGGEGSSQVSPKAS